MSIIYKLFTFNKTNINKFNKRNLQSFPESLLKHARKINKKENITVELTIPQYIMKKEKCTEKRDFCEYCKGCGIIICLECEVSNEVFLCYKCNGHKYSKCYICNGSGISHRTF